MQPENAVGASVAAQTPAARGGCLSTLLVVMIIANAFTAFTYLLRPGTVLAVVPTASLGYLHMLGVVALANVAFALMIWNWRRIGFWGIIVSTLVTFVINFSNNLAGFGVVGLILPIILAWLLRPHWAHLK